MSNINIIDREDESTARDLDKGVKNKWKWSWIEKQVHLDISKVVSRWKLGLVKHSLRDCIRKVGLT